MIPVMTPAQMARVDANAPEGLGVLVQRAATKVATAAVDLMGGTYGRRVVVVAGPGNNGADGTVAAGLLRRRGARVEVIDARHDDLQRALDACSVHHLDLVIDAAFGTGFHGSFEFPDVGDTPVLAVDIPSGVNGLTGAISGRAVDADLTVTFAALKPGNLFGAGAGASGRVRLVDIGLDVSGATMHLVEDRDVAKWLPQRPRDAHKWDTATWIFAGSPGMAGAARLCCRAAQRAGAGYVRHTPLRTPSTLTGSGEHVTGGHGTGIGAVGDGEQAHPVAGPVAQRVAQPGDGGSQTEGSEAVVHHVDPTEWSDVLARDASRFGSVAIGPGLGRDVTTVEAIRRIAALDGFPLLIDGDGLNALGVDGATILSQRRSPTVLTPHDREFERLTGSQPGDHRVDAVCELAASSRSVVLLKGPTTVVADPNGRVLLSNSGDSRLATAGTGDVLSGMIAAHLAMGAEPLLAAAAAAFIHGRAAAAGPRCGVVAGDLVAALPEVYSELMS